MILLYTRTVCARVNVSVRVRRVQRCRVVWTKLKCGLCTRLEGFPRARLSRFHLRANAGAFGRWRGAARSGLPQQPQAS